MHTKMRSVARWPLLAGVAGMAAILLSCSTEQRTSTPALPSVTPTATEAASLRLEDGALKVKAQGEDEQWLPVAGETTFELQGEAQSLDPWMVTGNTFAIRDTTQIAEGLEMGQLVKVQGIILDDNTWLANSIAPAADEQPLNPAITLVGKLNSTDPWVVHGIQLNVTIDTVVTGEVMPDLIVVVEILLLEDGTWEVLNIAPLSTFTEIPGCATVMATVESVSDNEVQFRGWPAIGLEEGVTIENESSAPEQLSPGQSVLVVVCMAEGGGFLITKIIVLEGNVVDGFDGEEKVLICHKPGRNAGHTLRVRESAVTAHLAHGDTLGACP
ncbi:MAG TPA: DUF5666 domain-containing protein [Anaerolineales bacterium]|nr:DUF5666 domain-containing protein [Anaerolineales bacterium]